MPRKVHSLKEKLVVVKRYLSGESAMSLEHEYGIDHHDVVMHVNRYVRYGEDSMRPRVSKVTPVEVKLQDAMEYLEHSVSLTELVDIKRQGLRFLHKNCILSDFNSLPDALYRIIDELVRWAQIAPPI